MNPSETETKPLFHDPSSKADFDMEYYLFEVGLNDHLENQIQRLTEMEEYYQQQSQKFEKQ